MIKNAHIKKLCFLLNLKLYYFMFFAFIITLIVLKKILNLCITILSSFVCVCNNGRFEYAYTKIYGQTFLSIVEFKKWKKKQQMIYLSYLINFAELSIHIFFLFMTIAYLDFVKKELIFYTISCLILYIYAICCIFIVVLSCIFLCIYNGSIILWYLLYKPQSLPEQRRYYIDEQRECCICMEKDNKVWIETQCGHAFHYQCIRQWNIMSNTCPICRSLLSL